MEGLIRKHFAGIPAKANPKPRPVYEVPKQPGTLYSIVTDPEAPMSTDWPPPLEPRLVGIAGRSGID